MRTACLLLVLFLSALALCGCKARQMNTSEFYVFCWTADNNDQCDEDLSICGDFRTALESDAIKSLSDCQAACEKTFNETWRENLFNGCSFMVIQSRSLCDQYCQRKFQ